MLQMGCAQIDEEHGPPGDEGAGVLVTGAGVVAGADVGGNGVGGTGVGGTGVGGTGVGGTGVGGTGVGGTGVTGDGVIQGSPRLQQALQPVLSKYIAVAAQPLISWPAVHKYGAV